MPVKTGTNTNRQQKRRVLLSTVDYYLKITSLTEYQDWCLQHGFSTNLNKTEADVIREYRYHKQRLAFHALRKISKQAELRTMLRKIYTSDIEYEELASDQYKAIYDVFRDTEDRDLLRDVLLYVGERSRILEKVEYIQAIERLVSHKKKWLRSFNKWKPKSKNAERQFQTFLRQLCANYDVPVFMDSAWTYGGKKAIGWYFHIGLGKNIRTAKGLPFKLSKKMAHNFLHAPDYYTPWKALRWAQVMALGGQKHMADGVIQTRLGNAYKDNEFWITVIQFFVNNPMLHRMHYGPIVDYIFNKKYAENIEEQDVYNMQTIGGDMPDFNMKGRTPSSMLRLVNDWHRELGLINKAGNIKWKSSNIAGLNFVDKCENTGEKRIWIIRELLSSKELYREGFIQNHCVATYDEYCKAGDSAIWTMESIEHDVQVKRLTIEVELDKYAITEVRGRNNRCAYSYEIDILKKWAKMRKLSIEPYVLMNE